MSTGTDAELGNYIRRERLKRNLSIKQLAEMTWLHRNTLSALENGQSVKPGTIDTVMDALDLPRLARGRDLTGRSALVSSAAVSWFLAAPAEAQDHAIELLVTFFADHPRGGSTRARGGGGHHPTLFAAHL